MAKSQADLIVDTLETVIANDLEQLLNHLEQEIKHGTVLSPNQT